MAHADGAEGRPSWAFLGASLDQAITEGEKGRGVCPQSETTYR
jgi:hypothetical protein